MIERSSFLGRLRYVVTDNTYKSLDDACQKQNKKIDKKIKTNPS
jgi:hypothetical protein